MILGRRGDTAWLTTVSSVGGLDQLDRRLELATTPRAPVDVSFTDGALNGEQWMGVVAEAVGRINAGDLEKVVLARDLVATAAEPIDVRWPLRKLAEQYPTCWTFHVDGIFGATPELYVRRELRTGHLAGAGRHHPAYRRRRPRPHASRPGWRGRRRTSRSTSTPSARSPSRWRRTARR